MDYRPFSYPDRAALEAELAALGETLPLSEDLSALARPLTVGGKMLNNRLAVQPMEGCDGEQNGAPSELTRRRYRRFAAGGAALIWEEATAVVPEGRANPRQLMLTPDTLDGFKAMVEEMRTVARKQRGIDLFLVLQATHSGRYSKPEGAPAPLIAYNNPVFEKEHPIDPARIVSDEYLAALPERYAATARLAEEAGFDAVDVKCYHRYLLSELLSAYERPGRYGGDFDNRTRLYRECIEATKAAVKDTMVTSRLNLYDGFPYPYGFGVSPAGGTEPDLAEPLRLVKQLHEELGLALLDITIGNPYVNPHVNRPYDRGGYPPPEHPLKGVARMAACVSAAKHACPDLTILSSGNSYLRHLSPAFAAGMVAGGHTDLAGFGREAFAYPDFAGDILEKGQMDPKKCCITCGKCTDLMRSGSMAGCVVRDTETYLPLYRRDVLKKED